MRIVRMKLGDEIIELTAISRARRPADSADSRSNDHWFQHIAIVVSDMDKAYQQLRAHKVQHTSTGPQTDSRLEQGRGRRQGFLLQRSGRPQPGDSSTFHRGKATRSGNKRTGVFF